MRLSTGSSGLSTGSAPISEWQIAVAISSPLFLRASIWFRRFDSSIENPSAATNFAKACSLSESGSACTRRRNAVSRSFSFVATAMFRGQHELLNHLMTLIVLNFMSADHATIFVEIELQLPEG